MMEESDDEWEDDEPSTISDSYSDGSPRAFLPYKACETARNDLVLSNFVNTGSMLVLNRCEPVNKLYPSCSFPSRFQKYDTVVLSLVLFHHDCENIEVRCPDLKDKFKLHRNQHGVWINPVENNTVRMKKKAVDSSTKRDIAFRLSTDFKFHTNGIEPCFIFTAIPFVDGVFLYDEASVSGSFFVRSKRQERHTAVPSKRRKKAREISKLQTDINSAEEQLKLTQERVLRLKSRNNAYGDMFRNMRNEVGALRHSTCKIALEHAFRPVDNQLSNSVTL